MISSYSWITYNSSTRQLTARPPAGTPAGEYTVIHVGSVSGYPSDSQAVTVRVGEPSKLPTPSLTEHATATDSLTIRWNAIANAGSYIVRYRLNQSGTSFGTSNIVQSSPTSGTRQAVISGLSSGTSYIIEVVAVPTDGTAYSNSNAGPDNHKHRIGAH